MSCNIWQWLSNVVVTWLAGSLALWVAGCLSGWLAGWLAGSLAGWHIANKKKSFILFLINCIFIGLYLYLQNPAIGFHQVSLTFSFLWWNFCMHFSSLPCEGLHALWLILMLVMFTGKYTLWRNSVPALHMSAVSAWSQSLQSPAQHSTGYTDIFYLLGLLIK